jgi:hypothetical protein
MCENNPSLKKKRALMPTSLKSGRDVTIKGGI